MKCSFQVKILHSGRNWIDELARPKWVPTTGTANMGKVGPQKCVPKFFSFRSQKGLRKLGGFKMQKYMR